MLKKVNGFTLIEVIIASSLLFSFILILVPAFSILHVEQTVLHDRLAIAYKLHDEMQPIIWENDNFTASYDLLVNKQTVTIEIDHEHNYLKGCAYWKNAKQTNEEVCLYAEPS